MEVSSIILFLGIGGWEVFLILAVFLLLFGAKKIPDMARGLGKGIKEFREASAGIKQELQEHSKDLVEKV
jgi:sec-independent protein translocase protein TatA